MTIVKKYTDKMLEVALKNDGIVIGVFDTSVKNLIDNYFDEDSYLISIIKANKKKYNKIKINKRDRKIVFNNGSVIYFGLLKTENQMMAWAGGAFQNIFLHNLEEIPKHNIMFILTKLRLGSFTPSKEYRKDFPYLYFSSNNNTTSLELVDFMKQITFTNYQEICNGED